MRLPGTSREFEFERNDIDSAARGLTGLRSLRRLLLGFSAVTLAAGGFMHAAAFERALSAVAASNLGSFYTQSFKALWLIDSATLLTLAIIFGPTCCSLRPSLDSSVLFAPGRHHPTLDAHDHVRTSSNRMTR